MTYNYHKRGNTNNKHLSCVSLMQHMCETTLDAIIIYDETGQIYGVNGGVETIFAYSERELLGKNINLILPTLDFKARHLNYLTQMTTASQSSGNSFPVEMMLTEFHDEDSRYYLVIIRDLAACNPDGESDLSPRQRQILKLVVQGYTSREIAEQLTISIKTVETHRANIMSKLRVRNVSSLVRYAVENNII